MSPPVVADELDPLADAAARATCSRSDDQPASPSTSSVQALPDRRAAPSSSSDHHIHGPRCSTPGGRMARFMHLPPPRAAMIAPCGEAVNAHDDEVGRSRRERWWRSALCHLATVYVALLLVRSAIGIFGGFARIVLIVFVAWLLAFVLSPVVGWLAAHTRHVARRRDRRRLCRDDDRRGLPPLLCGVRHRREHGEAAVRLPADQGTDRGHAGDWSDDRLVRHRSSPTW